MKAIVFLFTLCALCLALEPALAGAVAPQSAVATSKADRPRPKVIDLDFSGDDGPDETVPAKPPVKSSENAPLKAAVRSPAKIPANAPANAPGKSDPALAPASHRWVYWTMGATVMAAAAGGAGWYWHKEQTKTPTVTRNEQVFTDDRP